MLVKIFFSRRHPAPDVPLRLVRVQHLAGFAGKGRVDLDETVGDVLMHFNLVDNLFQPGVNLTDHIRLILIDRQIEIIPYPV